MQRAGYTRGAFYVHFRNREELVAAAIDERRESIAASFLTREGVPRGVFELLATSPSRWRGRVSSPRRGRRR